MKEFAVLSTGRFLPRLLHWLGLLPWLENYWGGVKTKQKHIK